MSNSNNNSGPDLGNKAAEAPLEQAQDQSTLDLSQASVSLEPGAEPQAEVDTADLLKTESIAVGLDYRDAENFVETTDIIPFASTNYAGTNSTVDPARVQEVNRIQVLEGIAAPGLEASFNYLQASYDLRSDQAVSYIKVGYDFQEIASLDDLDHIRSLYNYTELLIADGSLEARDAAQDFVFRLEAKRQEALDFQAQVHEIVMWGATAALSDVN